MLGGVQPEQVDVLDLVQAGGDERDPQPAVAPARNDRQRRGRPQRRVGTMCVSSKSSWPMTPCELREHRRSSAAAASTCVECSTMCSVCRITSRPKLANSAWRAYLWPASSATIAKPRRQDRQPRQPQRSAERDRERQRGERQGDGTLAPTAAACARSAAHGDARERARGLVVLRGPQRRLGGARAAPACTTKRPEGRDHQRRGERRRASGGRPPRASASDRAPGRRRPCRRAAARRPRRRSRCPSGAGRRRTARGGGATRPTSDALVSTRSRSRRSQAGGAECDQHRRTPDDDAVRTSLASIDAGSIWL